MSRDMTAAARPAGARARRFFSKERNEADV